MIYFHPKEKVDLYNFKKSTIQIKQSFFEDGLRYFIKATLKSDKYFLFSKDEKIDLEIDLSKVEKEGLLLQDSYFAISPRLKKKFDQENEKKIKKIFFQK